MTETEPLEVPRHRRLIELFVRGRLYTLVDDELGLKEEVWLQKMNPVEHKEATRAANAARATMLSAQFDKQSDEYLEMLAVISIFDKEQIVEQLLAEDRVKLYPVFEEEFSLKEPWKDGYLLGLQDQWNDKLEQVYAEDPHNKEAVRVRKELLKFRDQVRGAFDAEIQNRKQALLMEPERELVERLIKLSFKLLSEPAWLEEFARWEIYFCTRDPETKERVFPDRESVNLLQAETIQDLVAEIRQVTVDPVEGKDSAATPPS